MGKLAKACQVPRLVGTLAKSVQEHRHTAPSLLRCLKHRDHDASDVVCAGTALRRGLQMGRACGKLTRMTLWVRCLRRPTHHPRTPTPLTSMWAWTVHQPASNPCLSAGQVSLPLQPATAALYIYVNRLIMAGIHHAGCIVPSSSTDGYQKPCIPVVEGSFCYHPGRFSEDAPGVCAEGLTLIRSWAQNHDEVMHCSERGAGSECWVLGAQGARSGHARMMRKQTLRMMMPWRKAVWRT